MMPQPKKILYILSKANYHTRLGKWAEAIFIAIFVLNKTIYCQEISPNLPLKDCKNRTLK